MREEQYRLSVEEQRIEDELRLAIETAAEIAGTATWRTESRMTFDSKANAIVEMHHPARARAHPTTRYTSKTSAYSRLTFVPCVRATLQT